MKKYMGFLIGLFIFSLSLFLLISSYYKDITYEETTAELVDWEEYVDSEGDDMYTPIYEYNVNGEIFTYKSTTTFNGEPEIGRIRNIGYSPKDPNDFYFARNLWIKKIAGFILLILGIAIMRNPRPLKSWLENISITPSTNSHNN